MIRYRVDIDRPQGHTARVQVVAPADSNGMLRLCFPAWTPGSYLLREFARYAGEPAAHDADGNPLTVARPHHGIWEIAAPAGTEICVSWDAWAHELTVRTPHIDASHAFFTGTNLLPLVDGRTEEPAVLEVRVPPAWDVFCALDPIAATSGAEPGNGSRTVAAFSAPDYDVLADAIVEAGPHRHCTFEVAGVPHRIVVWEDGACPVDLERLAEETRAVVEANAALFGGLPYPRYDVVVHVTESGRGGLEHLNATALAVPWRCFDDTKARAELQTLIAHEHLHVWNGKRIRPKALGPFDYMRENHTRALWVVEGLTVYMDELQTLRAGLIDPHRYLELTGQAIRRFETTPGRFGQSLADASIDAWIRLYRPDENTVNRTVSYYLKGGLVWMCLDLHIRAETGGARSVDDVLRHLWQRWEADGAGYDDDALPGLIRAATGVDVSERIAQWVEGREVQPDIDAALASHGVVVERHRGAAPDIGLVLGTTGDDVTVTSVVADGPNADGFIAPGDVLVALGGRRVRAGSLDTRLAALPRGATVSAHVFRRGVLREGELATASEGVLERVELRPDAHSTPARTALRRAWLGAEPEEPG